MLFYEEERNKQKTDNASKFKYQEIESEINSDRGQHLQKPADPFKQQQQQQSPSNMRQSVLLADEKGEEEQTWWSKVCSCSCTKLETYKDYFNVTNTDVLRRIKSNLTFWTGGFFQPADQVYDFYGPFWIYTTVIFCLSAVPNILKYQVSDNFGYNFSVVGTAFGFVYIEGFLYPVIMTFILKFLGSDITHIENICLFGYSMCVMVLCLVLCSLNSCILHIILLLIGAGVKALFILKNLLPRVHSARKLVVIGLVILEAALIFFVFKLAFIVCQSGSGYTDTTSLQAQIAKLQEQIRKKGHYFVSRTFVQ